MSDLNPPDEFDWGGDGSDLRSPVAAHVRAALAPTDGNFPPPLDQLLQLGHPHNLADHAGRLAAIELSEAHIPDLIRLARDRELNTRMDDAPAIWAPIHALLALKRFDVGSQAAELIPLFDVDSEWFGEELPHVLGKAGTPAIEPPRRWSRWASSTPSCASRRSRSLRLPWPMRAATPRLTAFCWPAC